MVDRSHMTKKILQAYHNSRVTGHIQPAESNPRQYRSSCLAKAQKTCHGDDIQHPRGSLPPRSVLKKNNSSKEKHLKDLYSCLKKFESFITFITSNYHPYKKGTWQVCEQIPPFFTSEIPSTPNDSFDSSPVMYFTENSATAACGRFTL